MKTYSEHDWILNFLLERKKNETKAPIQKCQDSFKENQEEKPYFMENSSLVVSLSLKASHQLQLFLIYAALHYFLLPHNVSITFRWGKFINQFPGLCLANIPGREGGLAMGVAPP